MSHRSDCRATSLLELLIAVLVLCLVMFGIYNIQLFSDSQVVSASRKATLESEATYLIEHMSKYLGKAVSNARTYPVALSGDRVLIWNDKSPYDGVLQDHLDSSPDTLVYYDHASSGAVTFCANASTSGYPGTVSCNSGVETLASHVVSSFASTYISVDNTTNCVGLEVTSCWNPSSTSTCGKLKNPAVSLKNRVDMPSVSALQ